MATRNLSPKPFSKMLQKIIGLLLLVPLALFAHPDHEEELVMAREAFDAGHFVAARKRLIPLAAEGEPEALFRLAIIYERGLGVAADAEIAEQLYSGFCPLPMTDEEPVE